MRTPALRRSSAQSALVSSMLWRETSHIATLAPSAASWRTSSRPIPEPPPVTTAILPAKLFMGWPLALGFLGDQASAWTNRLPSPPRRHLRQPILRAGRRRHRGERGQQRYAPADIRRRFDELGQRDLRLFSGLRLGAARRRPERYSDPGL